MVSKTYSSSYESVSSRSRSARKYGSYNGPDPSPRSRSSGASLTTTNYDTYTPKTRSRSAYSSSSYSSVRGSVYTPGSYTSSRTRSTGNASVKDDMSYRYGSTVTTALPPRRRYSLSVDRDVGRALASDTGHASTGRGTSVDPSGTGDSFVLGYASVKTRSDPDEPIPHAYIAAPEFGHATVRISEETKRRVRPPPEPIHLSAPVVLKKPRLRTAVEPVQLSTHVPLRQPRPRPVVEPIPLTTPVPLPTYIPPKSIPHASLPPKSHRRREYDFSYNTYGFELGRGHERLDVDELDVMPTRGRSRSRSRRPSLSRQFIVNTDVEPLLIRSRARSRASSLSRFPRAGLEDSVIVTPRRRSASISRLHGIDHEVGLPVTGYGLVSSPIRGIRSHHELGDLRRSASSGISHMVVEPGSRFEPSNISMVVLPSGKKAVTYEHVSQYGKGDHGEANVKIEEIIMRTRRLQDSMHLLEDFVKANRSWFPEETLIYQHIEFFQLNEAQLLKIGASPDAVVYGIRMKERLVVPYGTDVTEILQKFYGKRSQYEIEYRDRAKIQEGVAYYTGQEMSLKDRIRKQVEEEWDLEHQKQMQLLAAKKRPLPKEPELELELHHVNKLARARPKPDSLPSFHVNTGLDYDSIYSQRSVGSALSDQDSTITKSSLASSRKKRLDAAPQFMSKLRPKRCTEGQTIRLNCSVQGLPLPEVSWYRGNYLISDGGRYRISVSRHAVRGSHIKYVCCRMSSPLFNVCGGVDKRGLGDCILASPMQSGNHR